MRSTSVRSTHVNDLTTRARLRDAAIMRFVRDGFGASLRSIADDAGMSAGIVIHHFGSKAELRAACDEYVFGRIRDSKRDVVARRSGPVTFLGQLAQMDENAHLIGYAMRSLQAGGVAARAFVDHIVADAIEYLTEGVAAGLLVPSRDEKARARYLVGVALGPMMLDMAIDPPAEPTDFHAFLAGTLEKLTLPALELFTEGFFVDRNMLDEYLLYIGDPPGPLTAVRPHDPDTHTDLDEESNHVHQHPGHESARD